MGMDEVTGRILGGEDYVRQCVRRSLRTLRLSMIMHREIGSDLQPYLALPTTDIWMLSLTGELTQSIETLLPMVKVTRVDAVADDDGQLQTSVSVKWQEQVFSVSSKA
jgi:phage baseplate assembly protein W